MQRVQRVAKIDAPPTVQIKKAYPNLDAIFGHVFSKLIGEPITPNKIAIFYLVRILFQTHFGFRHQRTTYPQFTVEEKSEIFQWLYSLITSNDDLTYDSFRMIIRTAFHSNRDIFLNFISAMEHIGSGESGVNFGIEDEFYTHKYAKDPTGERMTDDSEGDLKFSSQYSFVYRWLKRVLAQYSKTTSQELFEINQMMRNWINKASDDDVENLKPESISTRLGTVLPREIDSSLRARQWVARNIHFMHKNPRRADPHDHILNYVKLIQKFQSDVYEAHLLESIVHVQKKDVESAIKAMKIFFIDSMFQLNENMKHLYKTHRLAVPSKIPLMYAPILEARICRWFGNFTTARSLLIESVQQAQLSGDEICHQMGNTELHTLDIIGCGPILEDRTAQNLNSEKNQVSEDQNDRRIHRKTLKHIDDLHGHVRCGPCCAQTVDDFELVAELDSYGMMLMLMKSIVEGHYRLKYSRNAETGMACSLGVDQQERGRKVSDYGFALMSSNMIRNGLFRQAKTTTSEMLSGNLEAKNKGEEDVFHTESFAVTSANLAYSYAATGHYPEALATIQKMKTQFPEHLTWQSARHTTICDSVIRFEISFMMNKFRECHSLINPLAKYSQLEFTLRKALLLSASGRDREAILMLKNLEIEDVHGQIRRHLQLASCYTAQNSFEKAQTELDKALELSDGTTFKHIRTMIGRRWATMMMHRGSHTLALEQIIELPESIEQFGSFIERCCFYLTAARCCRMTGHDSRPWLTKLRVMNLRKVWPTMEKMVLSEIAALHVDNGLMPDKKKLGQVIRMYEEVECDYPGKCHWLLL
ncbi:hypothetical protein CAEBREN_02473 [Caenorhabditis brenneri]|uniref:Cyclosome subunit 5 n=1 Tax=Caenorhabditis brenneri TaxID=135651 RepID=G0N1N9_CAEBE|nr:hypothetical protein CAEBREN_02473 [Caenorhabditis brenneri]